MEGLIKVNPKQQKALQDYLDKGYKVTQSRWLDKGSVEVELSGRCRTRQKLRAEFKDNAFEYVTKYHSFTAIISAKGCVSKCKIGNHCFTHYPCCFL